jgi:integrase
VKDFPLLPGFSRCYYLLETSCFLLYPPLPLKDSDSGGLLPPASPTLPRKHRIMPKLTKRCIDALRPLPGHDLFIWDSELHGFGVRMKPSGSASFLVQYRTPQGRTRRYAFAKAGTLTPDEARAKARRLLAEAQDGGDPSIERHKARKALTVADLCDRYLEAAHAGLVTTRFKRPKRPSTVGFDGGRVARHIVPLLGNRPAGQLTRADVQRMADDIAAGRTTAVIKTKPRGKAVVTGGAGTAARVVGLLGGMWTWAEKRGFVNGPNPARGVETHRGEAKDRVLSKGELASLGRALQGHMERWPMACAAVRLCALTGLRRDEGCGLRWREIDEDGSCLRLSSSKTGRSTRPLGKAAIEHLSALPRIHNEWLFPNRGGTGSAELKKQIAAIFDAAGLKDARSHDLRRTFASTAAELGYSDATVAELLGHARRGVTERHYVRRPDAVLIEAASRTAQLIAAALDGKNASVIELRQSVRETTGQAFREGRLP